MANEGYSTEPTQSKQEAQEILKNRLAIDFAGLMSCTFLAVVDQVRESTFTGTLVLITIS
jgi:hypothetical protein